MHLNGTLPCMTNRAGSWAQDYVDMRNPAAQINDQLKPISHIVSKADEADTGPCLVLHVKHVHPDALAPRFRW